MIFEHKSVLLMETVDSLNVKPDGIYVDGTLGGGGHAYEVSRRLGENGRLIGIDQDADAIAAATERLLPFKDKVTALPLRHPESVRFWLRLSSMILMQSITMQSLRRLLIRNFRTEQPSASVRRLSRSSMRWTATAYPAWISL